MTIEHHKAEKTLLDERDVILVGSLGQQKRRNRTRWGYLLVVFMRIIATIWMVLGLVAWGRILAPGVTPLEAMPVQAAGAIIFFAVGDLLAATGLWMATPWGGVLWLVMLVAEIAALLLMPVYFPGGNSLVIAYIGLALSYFLLSYYAANEYIE
jgi:fatty acid desaturase